MCPFQIMREVHKPSFDSLIWMAGYICTCDTLSIKQTCKIKTANVMKISGDNLKALQISNKQEGRLGMVMKMDRSPSVIEIKTPKKRSKRYTYPYSKGYNTFPLHIISKSFDSIFKSTRHISSYCSLILHWPVSSICLYTPYILQLG